MEYALPPLRQELSLFPGPVKKNGSRAWILSDPAANRFFHISWPSLEILKRWHLGSPGDVVASVNKETPLTITVEHVKNLLLFVRLNYLTEIRDAQDKERLLSSHRNSRQHWAKWLLRNYLFLRIPLFRPDKFLDFFKPWVAFMFTAWFWRFMGVAAVAGGYLAFREWDSFISTFAAFGTWRQLLCFSGAIVLCKIAHEMGHAFAANRYGCRIGTMGIAFLVLFPMLFTDTTEAWKLPSRQKRLVIGASGILSELILAVFALLTWSFLSPGILKSVAFFLATTAWVLSLLMNLSPFMRFDGYFLLSDLTGMENLHERSFAFGRWFIRKLFLGTPISPPELLKSSTRNWLILFSFATWIYRFFLFLSIALLVYYAFFKVLGIILMTVEICWFICLPVWREIKQWWTYGKISGSRRFTVLFFCFSVLALILLFMPWRRTVSSPAIWRAVEHREIFAPFPARVKEIPAAPDQHVEKGDLLMVLEDPDLENRIHRTSLEIERLQWQLNHQPFDTRLLDQGEVLKQQLAEAVSRLDTGMDEAEKLKILSPISGVIAEMNEEIGPGGWLADKESIFYIITDRQSVVESFIDEKDLGHVTVGGNARFYPESLEWNAMACEVTTIDRINIDELEAPYLASIYGGDIPVRKSARGGMVPEYPLYRVQYGNCASQNSRPQIVRGRVVFKGKPESLFLGIFRRVTAVLIRESNF